MNNNRHIQVVNEELKQKNYYILDSLYERYDQLEDKKVLNLLKLSLQTNLIKENQICYSHNFPNYWNQIKKHFLELEPEDRQLILHSIEKIQTWNRTTEFAIAKIIKDAAKNLQGKEKIDFYLRYLRFFLSQDFLNNELNDPDFKSLWFISQINKGNTTYTDNLNNIVFAFSDDSFDLLMHSLEEKEKTWMFHDFKYLLEFTSVKLLYHAIQNKQIEFNSEFELPNRFFENKLIQRIYANLDINQENLSELVIKNLSSKIDFNFKFYGKEMNIFVKKHQLQEGIDPNFFIDGISSTESGFIRRSPFVPMSNLSSIERVDLLINLIEDTIEKKVEYVGGNFLHEVSIDGQIQEIISKLNTHDNWSNNLVNTKLFIEKMIDIPKLKTNYENAIIELILFGLKNNYLDNTIPEKYLENYEYSPIHNIRYNEERLFSALIEYSDNVEDSNNLVYRILFADITPKELSINNVFLNKEPSKWVDLSDFVNTSLGRYYSIIDKVPDKVIQNHFKEILVDGINSCQSPYNEYLKGKFYRFFDDYFEKQISEHSFIGFSHNYALYLNSTLNEFFKDPAKKLFASEITDSFILNNLSTVLLSTVNPNDLDLPFNAPKNDLREQLLRIMLQAYSEIKEDLLENYYFGNWFTWYIEVLHSNKEYFSYITLYLDELTEIKLHSLITIFRSASVDSRAKIGEYQFSYIRNIESLSPRKLELLVDCISTLLSKNVVNINYSFIEGVSNILKQLKEKDLQHIINDLLQIIKSKIPSSEYEKLYSKYFK